MLYDFGLYMEVELELPETHGYQSAVAALHWSLHITLDIRPVGPRASFQTTQQISIPRTTVANTSIATTGTLGGSMTSHCRL